MPRCRDDDLPQRKVDAASIAKVTRKVDATGFVVEVRDPEALLVGPLLGKTARKEFTRGGESVELEGNFGTLVSHQIRVSKGSGPNDGKRIRFGRDLRP